MHLLTLDINDFYKVEYLTKFNLYLLKIYLTFTVNS